MDLKTNLVHGSSFEFSKRASLSKFRSASKFGGGFVCPVSTKPKHSPFLRCKNKNISTHQCVKTIIQTLLGSVKILREGALDVASHKCFSKNKNISQTLLGSVKILREGALDVDLHKFSEVLGQHIKLYLVSLELDPVTNQGKVSSEAELRFDRSIRYSGKDALVEVEFSVPKDFGRPGALRVESQHFNEFFLKSVTLELLDDTAIHFPCNSWITDSKLNSGHARVFFTNQPCLPSVTPEALKKLREQDLELLRGDGTGERQYGERIYDYDIYNDLGVARPPLGGSAQLPYPRRCRTDPSSPSYLPRDEFFSPQKKSYFDDATIRSFGHDVMPLLKSLLDYDNHFNTFSEIDDLFDGNLKSVNVEVPTSTNPHNGTVFKFPTPGVVRANKEAWRTDQEFGRQRLAGSNPLCIERLEEFPLVSKLDTKEYGNPESSIAEEHLEPYLEGLTMEHAIKDNRLFILDYHDIIMPYVTKINKDGSGKIYASRTIFFLTKAGFLLPCVIELSLPPNKKGGNGTRRVFQRPISPDIVDFEWRLAKTHVAALDGGVHELISHWLRTHACVEPFIIATHRQLSIMHPLHTFLLPHFKDTMNINALARTALIKADGIIELCFTPGKYSIELSSVIYKGWRFDEQALPKDLVKRGMAEEDTTTKHGVKLVIKDYPYAEDGLEVWGAIKDWVKDYISIYYKKDEDVKNDLELQGWWKEVTEVGHGDHKGAEWWGEMATIKELEEVLITLIWLTSGHHAAVNFGQYAYFGFMPNCPTNCNLLIPERGTPEYEKMLRDPEKFWLKMVSSQGQAVLVMATVEVLAQHMDEEEYLGQRLDPQWTSDPRALFAWQQFQQALQDVETHVESRNANLHTLHNRAGPTLLPYTLLAPSSTKGLTFRGIPNSISI